MRHFTRQPKGDGTCTFADIQTSLVPACIMNPLVFSCAQKVCFCNQKQTYCVQVETTLRRFCTLAATVNQIGTSQLDVILT